MQRYRRGAGLVLAAWCVVLARQGATASAADGESVFVVSTQCTAVFDPPSPLPLSALPIAPPVWPAPLRRDDSAGPECPADVASDRHHARAEASASAGGVWSLATLASSDEPGTVLATAVIGLRTDIISPSDGDLFVRFDDVTGEFRAACCEQFVDAGYMTTISVSSRAGEFSVGCGTGDFRGPETSYTLPDDRCGLAEGGGAARLPVATGAVHVEIQIMAVSAISGADRAHPDSDGTRASARIASLSVAPSVASVATTNGGVDPGPEAATLSATPGGSRPRTVALARSGSSDAWLVAAGAALVVSGTVLCRVGRRGEA